MSSGEHAEALAPHTQPSAIYDPSAELADGSTSEEEKWLVMAASRAMFDELNGEPVCDELEELVGRFRGSGEIDELLAKSFPIVAVIGLGHVRNGKLSAHEILEAAPGLILEAAAADADSAQDSPFSKQLADVAEAHFTETGSPHLETILDTDEASDRRRVSNLQERNLALRAQQGDQHAQNKLIKSYYQEVGRIISKRGYYIGTQEHADLRQEGLIAVFSAIGNYNPALGSFRNLAILAIHRRVHSALKLAHRKKHQPLNTARSFDRPETAKISRSRTLLYEEFTLYEITPQVQAGIVEQLSAREALVRFSGSLSVAEHYVVAHKAMGLSYAEIEERTGYSQRSIDNALQRARKKMRLAQAEASLKPLAL